MNDSGPSSTSNADESARTLRTIRVQSLFLGCLAGVLVIATLDDPGITCDEPLDILPGQRYVQTLLTQGLGFFEPSTVTRTFRDNAEHPPLGRWLLGLGTMATPLVPAGRYYDYPQLIPARLAPAICFAALVGLVAQASGRRYGRVAGLVAGLALLTMPRAFAHAHFGALETFLALFWTWSLVTAERALRPPRPFWAMMGAGIVFGLALLTKIQAWFLIPIVGTTALLWFSLSIRGVLRATTACALWLLVALLVYGLGWPWLWSETLQRLGDYVGTGTERLSLQTLYFGVIYPDVEVPWHYPWVHLSLALPLGTCALIVSGVAFGWWRRRESPLALMCLGATGIFLVLFSTSLPVYDNTRLFQHTFAGLAIVAGLGAQGLWDVIGRLSVGRPIQRTIARLGLGLVVLSPVVGLWSTHPHGLCYYNELIGGTRGAIDSGLESDYWGVALDPQLLDELSHRVEPGQQVALVPTLWPGQPEAIRTRALANRSVEFVPENNWESADWLLVYRRPAYWPDSIRPRIAEQPATIVRSCQGRWLAGLWANESADFSGQVVADP